MGLGLINLLQKLLYETKKNQKLISELIAVLEGNNSTDMNSDFGTSIPSMHSRENNLAELDFSTWNLDAEAPSEDFLDENSEHESDIEENLEDEGTDMATKYSLLNNDSNEKSTEYNLASNDIPLNHCENTEQDLGLDPHGMDELMQRRITHHKKNNTYIDPPKATPFSRLARAEQNRLARQLFREAQLNIEKSGITSGNEKYPEMVELEADRLLANWISANSKN